MRMTSSETTGTGPLPRGDAARQRILRAAEQVFAQAGFGGATMARIAEAAALPKANLHYYFGTKEALYRAVLEDILEIWLDAADPIAAGADPAEALQRYIQAKLRLSRERPCASKVFANELLHGAPILERYLRRDLKRWFVEKIGVLQGWIDQGRIRAIDPEHLLYAIWAMTQTYADFDVQIHAVRGGRELGDRDFETAAATISALVLGGCGLQTTVTKKQQGKRT